MPSDVSGRGSGDQGGQQGSGWSADGSLSEDLQIKNPADSDTAEPLPIKGQTPPEEGQEPEPEEEQEQEAQPEEDQEGEEKQEPQKEAEAEPEVEGSLAELQGKLAQNEKLLQFYQNAYNELMVQAKGPQVQPPKPGEQAAKREPTPQPGQPDAELQAPPPEWKTTEEVVQYFDKRNQSIIQREIGKVAQQYIGDIDKSFQRVNQAIHAFLDRIIKPQLKDFDDVIKDVNNELFVLDPTGQNIVGYRNQALLQYFQSQPIPMLAMYDYGVSKRVPQKIKQAAREAVKSTVAKIAQKPKAPKQVKGGASSEEVGDLDWNTPRDKVEQILGKKRLI